MSRKGKEAKTNAVRILATRKIEYRLVSYDIEDGMIDGISVSQKVAIEPDRVFKTLVLQGHSKKNYVCVIPVNHELDLKKAARHFGEKNIAMIHSKELLPLTGYIHGGCSPIGMKKLFPTAIHESAKDFHDIGISGGKLGLQIVMNPLKLAELTEAEFINLIKE